MVNLRNFIHLYGNSRRCELDATCSMISKESAARSRKCSKVIGIFFALHSPVVAELHIFIFPQTMASHRRSRWTPAAPPAGFKVPEVRMAVCF